MMPRFIVLTGSNDKKVSVQAANICSVEDEDDYRLITYSINAQLHRCIKVKDTFNDIMIQINSFI